MRKIIGFVLLLAIAAWFKFGQTVADIDYKVKTASGDLTTQLANATITYHVPSVVRFMGADIYRPDGYFTQAIVKVPEKGAAAKVGAIVKAMNIGIPAKLDSRKAKLLGLEPEFTFWEEHGKWVLLGFLLCLLYAVFWR